MTNCNNNGSHFLFGLFLFLLGSFAGYMMGINAYNALPERDAYEITPVEGDNDVYISESGEFSFAHPDNTRAIEDNGFVLVIPAATEENDSPVPEVKVTVEDTSVQISTWEGMDVEYFDELVSSFELNN